MVKYKINQTGGKRKSDIEPFGKGKMKKVLLMTGESGGDMMPGVSIYILYD